MSAIRPIVVVLGATGQQGGAVFQAVGNSGEFFVRGVTRNPSSANAQEALAKIPKGNGELVTADHDDAKAMAAAFSGAWGAFVVTNFWDPKVRAREEEQVKAIADIALKAGVKFITYSSLGDAHTVSGGRHHLHHFVSKFRAEQYIRSLPFPEGSAFPYPGFFLTNFLGMMKPKKNERDGFIEFPTIIRADVAMPMVDLETEYGPTVLELFRNPKKFNGERIFTGRYTTFPQFAELVAKATGKGARCVHLPVEAGKKFGEELYDMLTYFNNHGYYAGAPTNNVGKPTDVEAWLKKHAHQF